MSQLLLNPNKIRCKTENCINLIDVIHSRSGQKRFCDSCIINHKKLTWQNRYHRKKKNAWQAMYDYARYHSEEEFRLNRIQNSIKYQKEHRKERNEYQNQLYAR